MRFDILYRTSFVYDAPVSESHNELRACPTTDDHQHLVSYRVAVVPEARVLSFTDYFGTRVDAFGVREPHRRMEIVAEASVETSDPLEIPEGDSTADLLAAEFVSLHHEYLSRTRHTDWNDAIHDAATDCATRAGPSVRAIAQAIHDQVRASIRYEKDVTDIGTPVADVLAGGAGVCQDFAHLAVAMCRSIGIPARYVSGYLFASDDSALVEGEEAPVLEVQTHAWIEVAVPGAGWFSLDPTNGRAVGIHHVKLGHGRDYDDVSPFRGVHSGRAHAELEASVEIRRGDPVLPGLLGTIVEGWGDAPSTPVRTRLGTRAAPLMPDLDQEQQQQQ